MNSEMYMELAALSQHHLCIMQLKLSSVKLILNFVVPASLQ